MRRRRDFKRIYEAGSRRHSERDVASTPGTLLDRKQGARKHESARDGWEGESREKEKDALAVGIPGCVTNDPTKTLRSNVCNDEKGAEAGKLESLFLN